MIAGNKEEEENQVTNSFSYSFTINVIYIKSQYCLLE
jgi:hypothetical protein